MRVALSLVLCFYVAVNAWALRQIFSITVGSGSTTSPQDYVDRAISASSRVENSWLVVNPSENFDLMVGETSTFTVTETWQLIPSSSGGWTSNDNEKFWLRYPPGASSETVRGSVDYK